MNDDTTLLIATGRIDDRLREAERARRAALVQRPASRRGWRPDWLARFRPFRGLRPVRPVASVAAPGATSSTVARPC